MRICAEGSISNGGESPLSRNWEGCSVVIRNNPRIRI